MDFSDFLPLFISESLDNLTVFEEQLVHLTPDPDDEIVNTLFRAIHSIKGGAGMFEAERLVEVAHLTESLLDKLRNGHLSVDNDLIDVLFEAKDVTETYVKALSEGSLTEDAREAPLKTTLSGLVSNGQEQTTDQPQAAGRTVREDINRLTIAFEQQAFMMGFRMEPLLQDIDNAFEVQALDIDYAGPSLSELDPEQCFLTLHVTVSPPMSEDQLQDLLSFSAGAEGSLHPVHADGEVDDTMLEVPDCDWQGLSEMEQTSTQQVDVIADKPTDAATAKSTEPSAGTVKPANKPAAKTKGELIKVNSHKLDRLVDEVGEMLSLKSQLETLLIESGDKQVFKLLKDFDKSLGSLRDNALSLRLVPLHETFSRFHRIVREAARMTEKHIHLDIIGGQTELDRVHG